MMYAAVFFENILNGISDDNVYRTFKPDMQQWVQFYTIYSLNGYLCAEWGLGNGVTKNWFKNL